MKHCSYRLHRTLFVNGTWKLTASSHAGHHLSHLLVKLSFSLVQRLSVLPKRLRDLTENFSITSGVFSIHCMEKTLSQPPMGIPSYVFFTQFSKREETIEKSTSYSSNSCLESTSAEFLLELCRQKTLFNGQI